MATGDSISLAAQSRVYRPSISIDDSFKPPVKLPPLPIKPQPILQVFVPNSKSKNPPPILKPQIQHEKIVLPPSPPEPTAPVSIKLPKLPPTQLQQISKQPAYVYSPTVKNDFPLSSKIHNSNQSNINSQINSLMSEVFKNTIFQKSSEQKTKPERKIDVDPAPPIVPLNTQPNPKTTIKSPQKKQTKPKTQHTKIKNNYKTPKALQYLINFFTFKSIFKQKYYESPWRKVTRLCMKVAGLAGLMIAIVELVRSITSNFSMNRLLEILIFLSVGSILVYFAENFNLLLEKENLYKVKFKGEEFK